MPVTKFTNSPLSGARFGHAKNSPARAQRCAADLWNLPTPPLPPPQDVSAEQSLELPELYSAGQKDELFNYWVFLQALAHGTATSLVNFFMTLWVSHDMSEPFSDYQSFAVVVALSGLLSITMEVGRAAAHPTPGRTLDTGRGGLIIW